MNGFKFIKIKVIFALLRCFVKPPFCFASAGSSRIKLWTRVPFQIACALWMEMKVKSSLNLTPCVGRNDIPLTRVVSFVFEKNGKDFRTVPHILIHAPLSYWLSSKNGKRKFVYIITVWSWTENLAKNGLFCHKAQTYAISEKLIYR